MRALMPLTANRGDYRQPRKATKVFRANPRKLNMNTADIKKTAPSRGC